MLKIKVNDGYQLKRVSLVYKFFCEKNTVGCIKSEIMPKQQLSKELHQTTDVSLSSILSACAKSSNINIPWQQLSSGCASNVVTSSHIVTLLFKTSSCDFSLIGCFTA